MSILLRLSGLALRQAVGGVLHVLGAEAGSEAAVKSVVRFLTDRFTAQSDKLLRVLERANEQAWHALEVSLAADSFWERLRRQFTSADVRAFRERVQTLLARLPVQELGGLDATTFQERCRAELHTARRTLLKAGGALHPQALAEAAGHFAAFDRPHEVIEAEWAALAEVGGQLEVAGHRHLARFVRIRDQDWPLLAVAVRYFLSRLIEADEDLFRHLLLQREGGVPVAQRQMLGEVHALLTALGERLDELLELGQATHNNTEQLLLGQKDLLARLEALSRMIEELKKQPPAQEPEPESVPLPALAPGEPVPAIPPRYVPTTSTPTEEMRARIPLWNGSLWQSHPTPSTGDGSVVPTAESPTGETVLGSAFAEDEPAEEVPAEEPPAEDSLRRGLPPLFDT